MALDGVRLAGLLAYCRIEEPDDADRMTLEGLYLAAVGYLEGAGVAEPPAGTPRRAQYDLCVNYLVLDGFDRRDITFSGHTVQATENPAFRRLINQLKVTELGEQEGT